MNACGVKLRGVIFRLVPVVLFGAVLFSQSSDTERQALIDRAKSFELKTPYVAPPGDPLSHHASGYAKIMCSAVFITGLDPEFAAENVGYFIAPYAQRAKFRKPVIDPVNKAVSITLPNGLTRTAKHFGSQGCITLPEGQATSISRQSPSKAPYRTRRRKNGRWVTRHPLHPCQPALT